jgi:hypothetical protein
MLIVKCVTPFSGESVSVYIDGEEVEFVRYAHDAWRRVYGEAEESEYSLEGVLETAYQKYVKEVCHS